jgi:hypothetical protein
MFELQHKIVATNILDYLPQKFEVVLMKTGEPLVNRSHESGALHRIKNGIEAGFQNGVTVESNRKLAVSARVVGKMRDRNVSQTAHR